MRALTLTSFGGLDGVVLTDVAEPEMPDDAVTVRVHAVALAKWDVTTALVIGAAGAVGGVVVQLGRDRGARMIASAGSADFGRVRDLGAADAVDRAGDVAAQVKDLVPEGVDVTIDLVGPAAWPSALAAA